MGRRPELLSSVMLRQNPHSVHEWHKRAKLFEGNPTRQVRARPAAAGNPPPPRQASARARPAAAQAPAAQPRILAAQCRIKPAAGSAGGCHPPERACRLSGSGGAFGGLWGPGGAWGGLGGPGGAWGGPRCAQPLHTHTHAPPPPRPRF
jgi:hypothetical protein